MYTILYIIQGESSCLPGTYNYISKSFLIVYLFRNLY